jgi:hypothetical protein
VDATSHGWRKSTYSDQTECVEVKFAAGRVWVRNSRRPEVVPIAFTPAQWREFLSGLTDGEFVADPSDG